MQLINTTPRTPWVSEIEAVIAKAMPSDLGGHDAIVRRWEAAEAAHYAIAIRNGEASDGDHESANDVLIRETRQMWREPVRGWPDVVARAKAALYWKWPRFDENEARKYQELLREGDDLDDGPLAHLIDAVMASSRSGDAAQGRSCLFPPSTWPTGGSSPRSRNTTSRDIPAARKETRPSAAFRTK